MPDLSIFEALYGQASTQDTASFRETSGCVDLLWEHWVDTTSAQQSLSYPRHVTLQTKAT